MSIKQKLLEAIDTMDLGEARNEHLVDILIDKLKAYKKQIEQLQAHNAHERLILDSEWQKVRQEYNEMRSNPNKWLTDQVFFQGYQGGKYRVVFDMGRVELYEIVLNTQYVCERISGEELNSI